MVSGRSEIEVNCSLCGKPAIELDLADRKKRICVKCVSDVPAQLSLLPRLKPKEKQRKACEARQLDCSPEPSVEQLALLPVEKPKPRPLKKVSTDYSYKVYCEQCRRKLDPCKEPWVAGMCQKCWPAQPALHRQYIEEWRKYNR